MFPRHNGIATVSESFALNLWVSFPKLSSPPLSDPVAYPEHLYLLISASLVKLTTPNKQFSSVG